MAQRMTLGLLQVQAEHVLPAAEILDILGANRRYPGTSGTSGTWLKNVKNVKNKKKDFGFRDLEV